MRLITNNVGDDLRIMFYPCQESELGFVNINLSEINWPHNRFTWLGRFPGYPGPEQKSIWAGMDWARTGRIDVWSVINYQVCELCHQTTGAVTTGGESRFNFPISLVSRKSQSIWTLWIIHWFQWECLLAFQLITVWCVWPAWASGPPWALISARGWILMMDIMDNMDTGDDLDGSSCQNVYQGSGLLTFQLKLNIIQSKTKTRISISSWEVIICPDRASSSQMIISR